MFQDFGAKAQAQEPVSRATAAGQAVELIARYPNLSDFELARVINLYRELSALDMALMLSDEELAPKLDNFFKDHGRRLRTPLRQYAALVAIAAAGIIVAVWAATLG
jgi:hypothetical protein